MRRFLYCVNRSAIEVFHTCDQNHVTAMGESILGVKLCNSCSGSGRHVIETIFNRVQESRNVIQTKYKSSQSIIHVKCDLPNHFILHINRPKHARFDENTQSLLGYTDIAIYLVFK